MAEKIKILVADDDIFYAKIMKRHIVRAGYEVSLAINGEEALAIVEKEKPAFAILDVMLPKMDGFSVLKKIRETSKMPVIMISNLAQESDKTKGMELGATDYIVKSDLTLKDIASKIKKHL